MDVYACGFNGFQQISQSIDTNHPSTVSASDIDTPYYSQPVKLKCQEDSPPRQQCLITWSKLLFRRKEDVCNAFAATWNQTLYRNAKGGYSVTSDSVTVDTRHDINIDADLSCVVGGEKNFYCLHDNGCLSQMIFNDTLTNQTAENVDSKKFHSTVLLRPVFTSLPVTDVSCGKEHVLFLTGTGQVFSFGLGSRGQLGHDSVDEETTPRLVDILDGLTVVAIAAGGWHSAAVTGSGDLFTWGWNESSQLGHASRNTLGNFPSKTSKPDDTQDASVVTADTEPDKITPQLPSSSSKETHSSSFPDVPEDRVSRDNSDPQTASGKNGSNSLVDPATTSSNIPDVTEACIVSETDDVGGVTLVSSPLLVTSLPDDYTAVKVSCGSRHTAVVTVEGQLYTTGWNKYGQLGQGHTRSTDSFVPVHLSNLKVKDVLCGFWNTVIFTE